MRVTRLTINCVAILCVSNVLLYMDATSPLTWGLTFFLGFFCAFPVDRIRKLYLLVADIRPRPRIWTTAVLADPQDGYEEEEDWRLIGTVTERR